MAIKTIELPNRTVAAAAAIFDIWTPCTPLVMSTDSSNWNKYGFKEKYPSRCPVRRYSKTVSLLLPQTKKLFTTSLLFMHIFWRSAKSRHGTASNVKLQNLQNLYLFPLSNSLQKKPTYWFILCIFLTLQNNFISGILHGFARFTDDFFYFKEQWIIDNHDSHAMNSSKMNESNKRLAGAWSYLRERGNTLAVG